LSFRSVLKSVVVKFSNSDAMVKLAKKILIYFPSLKSKLIRVRDNAHIVVDEDKIDTIYEDNFLDKIKNEIELNKKKNEVI